MKYKNQAINQCFSRLFIKCRLQSVAYIMKLVIGDLELKMSLKKDILILIKVLPQ